MTAAWHSTLCTAQELLESARRKNPHVRYALHRNGNYIGAYDPKLGRFVTVAAKLATGEWISCHWEVLVDGALPYTDADFDSSK